MKRLISWWKNLPLDADIDKSIWKKRDVHLTFKQRVSRDKLSVITTISTILIILLLLISSVNGYDYYQNITINSSTLPRNGTYEFTINPINNATIFFNMVNDSSKVSMSFPSNHTFNDSQPFNATFNWSIPDQTFLNDENLTEVINLANNNNSNIVTLGFDFFIQDYNPPILEVKSVNELQVVNGTYVKSIGITSLPDSGNLPFNLKGVNNSNFTVTDCTDFLECPTSMFYFNANGTKILNIPYHISATDVAVGTYNSSFKINNGNSSKIINVQFDIQVPNLFATPPDLPDKCFSDVIDYNVQLECEGIIQKYRANLIVEYQRYLANVNTDKICSDYVKYEYVVGDSISKEIMDTNQQLRDENAQIRAKLDEKNDMINNLKQDKINLQLQINQTRIDADKKIAEIKQQAVDSSADVNRNAMEWSHNFVSSKATPVQWIIALLWFIPLAIIGFQRVWGSKSFSKNIMSEKWLLIGAGIFFLLWLGSLYFL